MHPSINQLVDIFTNSKQLLKKKGWMGARQVEDLDTPEEKKSDAINSNKQGGGPSPGGLNRMGTLHRLTMTLPGDVLSYCHSTQSAIQYRLFRYSLINSFIGGPAKRGPPGRGTRGVLRSGALYHRPRARPEDCSSKIGRPSSNPPIHPLVIARNIPILASSIRYSQATLALARVRNWLV